MKNPLISAIMAILFLIPWSSQAQGLKFNGLEKPIDKRTSYKVFASRRAPEFSGYFEITFDLSLYPESELGYIVRIKNEKAGLIYNLFYDGQGNDLVFKLNDEARYNLINASIDREEARNMAWIRVKLGFDLKRDSLHLGIGKHNYSVAVDNLPDKYRPDIYFGKSDYFIDVPSFAIKDLSVGNSRIFSFPLDESKGDRVHDSTGRPTGEVSNPEWLINEAYEWEYHTLIKRETVSCAGYNPKLKKVYCFDRDSIFMYDVLSRTTEAQRFMNRCPVHLTLGTSFIDTLHNRIYAYEVYYSDPMLADSASVAWLDIESLQWHTVTSQQLPMQMHHHGTFFDQSRTRYTIFGGFGNMHYNGTFYIFDINAGKWYPFSSIKGDTICPRYFTSMGYDAETNKLYIYGGMGNESGDQVVGRKYLYDLYSLDFTTNEIHKHWDNMTSTVNMVPVRNMFIDSNGHFYTLCYPESHSDSYLQLYRFSIKNGEMVKIADTIPIHSDKITTNANLYYDRSLHKVFVTVQESDDDISSTLKVYSLSVLPHISVVSRSKGSNTLLWLALAAVFAVVLMVSLFIKRKSLLNKANIRRDTEETNSTESAGSTDETIVLTPQKEETCSNSIFLFGDFTAVDRDGKDVSGLFTGRQKQMLCILLEYNSTGGISSKKLSALLWPGKSEDKVKNTRNTTISHLRKTLSMFDGIGIVYENGNFKIHVSSPFWCDFLRLGELISGESANTDNLDEITSIVSRGKFLRFSDDPVFDDFKAEMERKIEPIISSGISASFKKKDYKATLSLADILFSIDPLNDKALLFTVRSLCKLNRLEDALLRYQTFTEEYRKAYGEDYPYDFDEL